MKEEGKVYKQNIGDTLQQDLISINRISVINLLQSLVMFYLYNLNVGSELRKLKALKNRVKTGFTGAIHTRFKIRGRCIDLPW